MQGSTTRQGNPFTETEPVLGVPVDQTSSAPTANAQNTLPVISDGFCVPHDVVFTLQANLNPRSTEIYNVIDSAGTGQFRVFAVNDSGSSMHLVDRDGRVILTLKSKFFSAHNKWYIYSGRGTDKENKIATVKPQSGTTSAEVYLKGKAKRHSDEAIGEQHGIRHKKAKQNPDFVMQGNSNVSYGKFIHQEDGYSKDVAEVNKLQNKLQRGQAIPSHYDAYSLHILSGVDTVFLLALCVALDEAVFSPQQYSSYGPYGRGGYGYGGYGYGGYGRGYGYGGMGYGAPLLLGAGLLATPFLFGGFW